MTKEQFNHEMERIAALDWSITATAISQVMFCMRYIESLEAENAKLEKAAIVWHRYPEDQKLRPFMLPKALRATDNERKVLELVNQGKEPVGYFRTVELMVRKGWIKQNTEEAFWLSQITYSTTEAGREVLNDQLKEQYISSLEAENAKLNRALDVLCNKLEQLACPPNANPHDGQPCNDSDDCVNCWREYALAEAEKGERK